MLLSIIIVSYNTKELLEKCLNSIVRSLTPDAGNVKTTGRPYASRLKLHASNFTPRASSTSYEIIVVDNNSRDDSVEMLENLKLKLENSMKIENLKLKIIVNNDNLGFAKAVNQGIKKSRGEYLLLLNSDTIVSPQALEKMIEFARKKKEAGIIAPKLLDKNGKTSQPSCYHLPTIKGAIKEFWLGQKGAFGKYLPRGGNPVKPEAAAGAAMLIPRAVYDVVGEFNEKYFMYYEDLDYCRRVREAGFAVYYLPTAKIIRYHGQSGKKEPQKVNRYLIESSKKYHGRLKHFFLNAIIRLGQAKKFLPLILLVLAMLAW